MKKRSILEFFKPKGDMLLEGGAKINDIKVEDPVEIKDPSKVLEIISAYAKEKNVPIDPEYIDDVKNDPSIFGDKDLRQYVQNSKRAIDIIASDPTKAGTSFGKSTSGKTSRMNHSSWGMSKAGELMQNTEANLERDVADKSAIASNTMVKSFKDVVEKFGTDEMISSLPASIPGPIKDKFNELIIMDKLTGEIEINPDVIKGQTANVDVVANGLRNMIKYYLISPFKGMVSTTDTNTGLNISHLLVDGQKLSFSEVMGSDNITSDLESKVSRDGEDGFNAVVEFKKIRSITDAKAFILKLGQSPVEGIINTVNDKEIAGFYDNTSREKLIASISKPGVSIDELSQLVADYAHSTAMGSGNKIDEVEQDQETVKSINDKFDGITGDVELPISVAKSILTFINRLDTNKILIKSQAEGGANTKPITVEQRVKDQLTEVKMALGGFLNTSKTDVKTVAMRNNQIKSFIAGVSAVGNSIAHKSRKDNTSDSSDVIANVFKYAFTSDIPGIETLVNNIEVPGYLMYCVRYLGKKITDPSEITYELFTQMNDDVAVVSAKDTKAMIRLGDILKADNFSPGHNIRGMDSKALGVSLVKNVAGWIVNRLNSISDPEYKPNQSDKKFLSSIALAFGQVGLANVTTGLILRYQNHLTKTPDVEKLKVSDKYKGDYAKDSAYILKQYQDILNSDSVDLKLDAIEKLLRNDDAWKDLSNDLDKTPELWSMFMNPHAKDDLDAKVKAKAMYILSDVLPKAGREAPKMINRYKQMFSLVKRNSPQAYAIRDALMQHAIDTTVNEDIKAIFKRIQTVEGGKRGSAFSIGVGSKNTKFTISSISSRVFPNTSLAQNLAIASFIASGGDKILVNHDEKNPLENPTGKKNGYSDIVADEATITKFVDGVIKHIENGELKLTDEVIDMVPTEPSMKPEDLITKIAHNFFQYINQRMDIIQSGVVVERGTKLKTELMSFVMGPMFNISDSEEATASASLTSAYENLNKITEIVGGNPIQYRQYIAGILGKYNNVKLADDNMTAALKKLKDSGVLSLMKVDRSTGGVAGGEESYEVIKDAIELVKTAFGDIKHAPVMRDQFVELGRRYNDESITIDGNKKFAPISVDEGDSTVRYEKVNNVDVEHLVMKLYNEAIKDGELTDDKLTDITVEVNSKYRNLEYKISVTDIKAIINLYTSEVNDYDSGIKAKAPEKKSFKDRVMKSIMNGENLQVAKKAISSNHKYRVFIGDESITIPVSAASYAEMSQNLLGDKDETTMSEYNKLGKFERFVVASAAASVAKIPVEEYIQTDAFAKDFMSKGMSIVGRGDARSVSDTKSIMMSLTNLHLKVTLTDPDIEGSQKLIDVPGVNLDNIQFTSGLYVGVDRILNAKSRSEMMKYAAESLNNTFNTVIARDRLRTITKMTDDYPVMLQIKRAVKDSEGYKDFGASKVAISFEKISYTKDTTSSSIRDGMDAIIFEILKGLGDQVEKLKTNTGKAHAKFDNPNGDLDFFDRVNKVQQMIETQKKLVNVDMMDLLDTIEDQKLPIHISAEAAKYGDIIKIDGSYIRFDALKDIDGSDLSVEAIKKAKEILNRERERNIRKASERYAHSSKGSRENYNLKMWEDPKEFNEFWKNITHDKRGDAKDVKSHEDMVQFFKTHIAKKRFVDASDTLTKIIRSAFEVGAVGGSYTRKTVDDMIRVYNSGSTTEDVIDTDADGNTSVNINTRKDQKVDGIQAVAPILNAKLNKEEYATFISKYDFVPEGTFSSEIETISQLNTLVSGMFDIVSTTKNFVMDGRFIMDLNNGVSKILGKNIESIMKKMSYKKFRGDKGDKSFFANDIKSILNVGSLMSKIDAINSVRSTIINKDIPGEKPRRAGEVMITEFVNDAKSNEERIGGYKHSTINMIVNGDTTGGIRVLLSDMLGMDFPQQSSNNRTDIDTDKPISNTSVTVVLIRNMSKIVNELNTILVGSDTTPSLTEVINSMIRIDMIARVCGEVLTKTVKGKTETVKSTEVIKGIGEITNDDFLRVLKTLEPVLRGVSVDDHNNGVDGTITKGGRSAESLIKFKDVYSDDVMSVETILVGKMAELAGKAKSMSMKDASEYIQSQIKKYSGDAFMANLKVAAESRVLQDPKAAEQMLTTYNYLESFFKEHGRAGMTFDAADMTLIKAVLQAQKVLDKPKSGSYDPSVDREQVTQMNVNLSDFKTKYLKAKKDDNGNAIIDGVTITPTSYKVKVDKMTSDIDNLRLKIYQNWGTGDNDSHLDEFINKADDMVTTEMLSIMKEPFQHFEDDEKLSTEIRKVYAEFMHDKYDELIKRKNKVFEGRFGRQALIQASHDMSGSIVSDRGRSLGEFSKRGELNSSTNFGKFASLIERASSFYHPSQK